MSEVLRFRRIKSQGGEKGRKFCSFTKVRFGAKFINSRTNKDKSKMKTKKDRLKQKDQFYSSNSRLNIFFHSLESRS